MRTTLLALLVTAAACHHDSSPQTPQMPPEPVPTAASNDNLGRMPADPTLPSWAPTECAAYHAAVVRFAECDAVAQASRNVVKTQYDTDDARWKAMHDQPPEQILYVRDNCRAAERAIDNANSCLSPSATRSAAR
ncbi:MAG TPA: hypothetical protein VGL61_23155 [Kofleriaceae bacterium]|jgi:hypothetical protein